MDLSLDYSSGHYPVPVQRRATIGSAQAPTGSFPALVAHNGDLLLAVIISQRTISSITEESRTIWIPITVSAILGQSSLSLIEHTGERLQGLFLSLIALNQSGHNADENLTDMNG